MIAFFKHSVNIFNFSRTMNIIRKIISVFEELYNQSSNSRFCSYLQNKGIKMGGGKYVSATFHCN